MVCTNFSKFASNTLLACFCLNTILRKDPFKFIESEIFLWWLVRFHPMWRGPKEKSVHGIQFLVLHLSLNDKYRKCRKYSACAQDQLFALRAIWEHHKTISTSEEVVNLHCATYKKYYFLPHSCSFLLTFPEPICSSVYTRESALCYL